MPRQRSRTLELEALSDEYTICRLPADAPLPDWAEVAKGADVEFVSISRTREELSIVCSAGAVP